MYLVLQKNKMPFGAPAKTAGKKKAQKRANPSARRANVIKKAGGGGKAGGKGRKKR